MVETYKLAVIGNGTSAINALRALIEECTYTGSVLPPIEVTIFGDTPEDDAGKGFAFGPIGGRYGNLTEAPDHADYQSDRKGGFRAYAARETGIPPQDLHHATRDLVGKYHALQHTLSKEVIAPEMGTVTIHYKQAWVNNLDSDQDDYTVISDTGQYGGFDRILVAVGDVLSSRFDEAAQKFHGQVHRTPYHALPVLDGDEAIGKTVVAFGTRSSFVDLVNHATADVIGVSTTGQTSWQAREGREPQPIYYLNPAYEFKTVTEILQALKKELCDAADRGAYVPVELLQLPSNLNRRLAWDYNLGEEYDNRNNVTYHDVSGSVNWNKIYEGLPRDEQVKFSAVLGDFVQYNWVNRIVPPDYEKFVGKVLAGDAHIVKSSFGPDDISAREDGRLNVRLANGQNIVADHVVNCAIGPAPAREQARTHELWRNLTEKGWASPAEGTRFDVRHGLSIDIVGNQARQYPHGSIGLESYGLQGEAWAKKLVAELAQTVEAQATARPSPRRYAHV